MADHFLTPKYVGKRFENHSIPLDVLGDLSVLGELLRELARDTYLVEEERERLPEAGIFDDVEILLSGVGEGSAVPQIDIRGDDELKQYFEHGKKRLIAGINAANSGGNVTAFIPTKQLRHFDKLGSHLQKNEKLQLAPDAANDAVAAFDVNIRNHMSQLYQQSLEGLKSVTIRGPISKLDLPAGTFTVKPPSGGAVEVVIDDDRWDDLSKAIAEVKVGRKLQISGVMDVKTRKIDSIDAMQLLDRLDIRARLDDLAKLKPGWLGNNEGKRLDPDVIQFLSEFLVSLFEGYKTPRLYPTEDGGIQAEWTVGSRDISMEIDPQAKSASVHILDLETDIDREIEVSDLSVPDSLAVLLEEISNE